jgi:hypothetical protein
MRMRIVPRDEHDLVGQLRVELAEDLDQLRVRGQQVGGDDFGEVVEREVILVVLEGA